MSAQTEVTVTIEIECAVCGSTLDAKFGGEYSWSNDVLKVSPCEQCMQDAVGDAIEDHERSSA